MIKRTLLTLTLVLALTACATDKESKDTYQGKTSDGSNQAQAIEQPLPSELTQ